MDEIGFLKHLSTGLAFNICPLREAFLSSLLLVRLLRNHAFKGLAILAVLVELVKTSCFDFYGKMEIFQSTFHRSVFQMTTNPMCGHGPSPRSSLVKYTQDFRRTYLAQTIITQG